ncbi:MAG TPA: hypothetical protein VFN49_10710 [Candidatus Aquilonibacter sp.]|nr:hypothetical protein [Candidatus Aquilonibacter sp.]
MHREARWRPALAIVVAVILYELLPPKLTFGPFWIVPVLVGVILVPLLVAGDRLSPKWHRVGAVTLTAILNAFNLVSVILLVSTLVDQHNPRHGSLAAFQLLQYGGLIWITNVICFALWYWEIDDGGVEIREGVAYQNAPADFLFPQLTLLQSNSSCVPRNWRPMFLDYLYLSFTNALAFSPTDVMPLSRIAKMLMLIESLISFVTVALILARSVNILS